MCGRKVRWPLSLVESHRAVDGVRHRFEGSGSYADFDRCRVARQWVDLCSYGRLFPFASQRHGAGSWVFWPMALGPRREHCGGMCSSNDRS
jgi:hypothetical protein